MNLLRVLLGGALAAVIWTILAPFLDGRAIAGNEAAALATMTWIRAAALSEQEAGGDEEVAARIAARMEQELDGVSHVTAPGGDLRRRRGYVFRVLFRKADAKGAGGIEAYAWPRVRHRTGVTAFALDPGGVIYRSRNLIQRYDGTSRMPAAGACRVRREAGTATGMIVGLDGERWTPVPAR